MGRVWAVRTAGTLAVLIALTCLGQASAYALGSMRGRASSGAATASTGTWQAVVTTAAAPPYPTGPLVVTVAKGAAAGTTFYLSVVNTGTLPLTAGTYAVTTTAGSRVDLESCSGSWLEVTDACLGTVTTVASADAGAAMTTAVPAAVGSTLRLRLRLLKKAPKADTVTVGLSIPRTGTRAARESTS